MLYNQYNLLAHHIFIHNMYTGKNKTHIIGGRLSKQTSGKLSQVWSLLWANTDVQHTAHLM